MQAFLVIFKMMKKRIFPTLIALSALSVSASAAFYSVTGLSKLFAGASLEVMIMAGSLEVAKLVVASLLYQYWGTINKALRTYLSVAMVVLVLLTSAGIYGFLSSAYQDTASKANVVGKEAQVYRVKKERFEQNRADYQNEKQKLDEDISQLRNALSTGSTTQSVDKKTGQLITKANNANRKTFETQLNSAITNKEIVENKLIATTDSISALDMKILDIESKAELSGELGPLKYISTLTGKSMDQIINWFLLIIIFVFDPLAIALVIAANFAFKQLKPTITPTPIIESEPKKEEEYEPMFPWEDLIEQEEYINEELEPEPEIIQEPEIIPEPIPEQKKMDSTYNPPIYISSYDPNYRRKDDDVKTY
jgi:hypothetical protein